MSTLPCLYLTLLGIKTITLRSTVKDLLFDSLALIIHRRFSTNLFPPVFPPLPIIIGSVAVGAKALNMESVNTPPIPVFIVVIPLLVVDTAWYIPWISPPPPWRCGWGLCWLPPFPFPLFWGSKYDGVKIGGPPYDISTSWFDWFKCRNFTA